MGISHEALALEQRAVGRNGEPTLALAYDSLLEQWRRGDHDRDVALHLMFLAWYLCTEPSFLTGVDDEKARFGVEGHRGPLAETFVEVHAELDRRMPLDPEFNYVVSVMASLFPWCCDHTRTETWERIAVEHRQTYERLRPQGLTPEVFEGQGFYGEYFTHMIRNES